MKRDVNINSKVINKNKEKLIIRIFLLLFIIAIFLWIIPSTIGFINLDSKYEGAGELPQWLQD